MVPPLLGTTGVGLFDFLGGLSRSPSFIFEGEANLRGLCAITGTALIIFIIYLRAGYALGGFIMGLILCTIFGYGSGYLIRLITCGFSSGDFSRVSFARYWILLSWTSTPLDSV